MGTRWSGIFLACFAVLTVATLSFLNILPFANFLNIKTYLRLLESSIGFPVESQRKTHKIVAVATKPYLEFAENWWHYLRQSLDDPSKYDIQLIALSPGLCEKLNATTQSLCQEAPPHKLREDPPDQPTLVFNDQYKLNTARKLSTFADIVDQSLDGDIILFCDIDVVFLADPFQFDRKTGEDFWLSPEYTSCPPNSQSRNAVNTGLFFVKVSPNIRNFFKAAMHQLLLPPETEAHWTDQHAISMVLAKGEFNYEVLPCKQYTNGYTFFIGKVGEYPVSIHPNYMWTGDSKKTCLQSAGLWFGDKSAKRPNWKVKRTKRYSDVGKGIEYCFTIK